MPELLRALPERVNRRDLITFLVSVAVLAVLFGPSLAAHFARASDPTRINDDARQQIFPFFRYEDEALFPDDYAGDYFLSCLPLGYRALYSIGAWSWGAEPLSKVVPYLLLLVTIAAVAGASRRLAGFGGAFVAAALVLSSSLFLARMGGGLPRSFGFPIMALTVFALVDGRPRLHAACVLLGAAFYPAAAVLAGMSLALSLLILPASDRGPAAGWSIGRRATFLATTALLAATIMAPTVIASRDYGDIIGASEVSTYPEAGPGGRYRAEDRAPFPGFFKTLPGVLEDAVVGAGQPFAPPVRAWLETKDPTNERYSLVLEVLLVPVLLGFAVLFLRFPGARRLLCLPFAALIGYSIARYVAPSFYLPQRYVLFPIPVTAVVMLASAGAGFLPARQVALRPHLPALSALVLGAAVLVVLGARGSRDAGLNVTLNPRGGMYEFARSLPKSAVLAGFPDDLADNLPYVSRRAVLVSRELHQAFHTEYTLEMRRRVTAIVQALYAEDAAPLLALKKAFGATHFYYRRSHLRGKMPSYFRPFDKTIQQIAANAAGKKRFIETAREARVYDEKDIVVLDLRKLH